MILVNFVSFIIIFPNDRFSDTMHRFVHTIFKTIHDVIAIVLY